MLDAVLPLVLVLGLLAAVILLRKSGGTPSRAPGHEPAAGAARDPPGVRTHVRFTGAERYMLPGEDPAETVTCGEGILTRLRAKLSKRGWTAKDIVIEDWGALLKLSADGHTFDLCAGSRGDDWLVFVTGTGGPTRPIEDSKPLRRLLKGVDRALRELPGIEDISWHRTEDWTIGDEDHGRPGPVDTPRGR